MTWEQKLLALKALSPDASLCIRTEGDWYVRVPGIEIVEGPVLRSLSGNGETPEEAVGDCWNTMLGNVLVRGAMSDARAEFVWTGFMWETAK